MANNRLFIVDAETGDRFLLAKSSGDGWWVPHKADYIERLEAWLQKRVDDNAAWGSGTEAATTLRLVDENHERP